MNLFRSIRLTLKSMTDMRTRLVFAALVAAAAFAACSRSEMSVPAVKEVPAADNIYSTKNAIRRFNITFSKDGFSTRPGGAVITASLGEEDDTRVHLGDGTSQIPVLWDADDYFYTCAINPGTNRVEWTYYETLDGGAQARFAALGGLPDADAFYHLRVPDEYLYGFGDLTEEGYGLVYIIVLPSEQTAVAGSADPDALISGAVSASASGDVSFYSAMSFLRFKLSGDIVSSVKNITISGVDLMAGGTGVYFKEGLPCLDFNLVPEDYVEPTNEITLSGTFVADQYYYIALAPGKQAGLVLTFSDGAQGYTTKIVSKEVSFQRGRITDFGTIALGNAFSGDPTLDVAELYMEASAGAPKPVSIVVVPDGYTEEQLPNYKIDAYAGINALFNTEPFKTYKSYFNVWILYVASAESGANITDGSGNIVTPRNCYFGSKWGESSYDDMALDESTLYNFVSANCPDLKSGVHTANETPVLVIINDSRYGGICHSYSNGKAYCQAPVTAGGLAWGYPEITAVSESDPSQGTRAVTAEEIAEVGTNYNGDWRNTLVHEFGGHAFGRLGDEYWYDQDRGAVSSIGSHTWTVPFSLNISAKYTPTPWTDDLLSRRTSLVASNPLYARLGTFQGGDVSSLNRWRSEKISCMIDNRFYFSLRQRQLIVKRIMTLAGKTFNLSDFLSKDDPTDPIRDISSSGVMDSSGSRSSDFAPIMPPLPPPVLIEE